MEVLIQNKCLPLYFAAPVGWYVEAINMHCLKIAEEPFFEKQTLRNRLNYGTFQGVRMFTIPLVHATMSGPYKKVAINYTENWQNKLINALQTAYGKSPFFEFYGYRFESILLHGYELLWDLNFAILKETLNCMKTDLSLELMLSTTSGLPVTFPDTNQYYQVFTERVNFMPGLSIFDLLYNEGPDAFAILHNTYKTPNK